MKRMIKRGLLFVSIGFVVMFVARLSYGYLSPKERAELTPREGMNSALITALAGRDHSPGDLKNYASEKLKVQQFGDSAARSIDQKYEKVASVSSKTKQFDEDESAVRQFAIKHSALIQFEQSSGLPESRYLDLAIGVPPNRFDPMIDELKSIGELSSIRIDKTDKTNEYKELKARRASLEKTRDSLMSLKTKAGRIDEFTNLENRILEIEEQIQTTGVELGDYDQENEFCTIRLTLTEIGAALPGISFRHRVVVALAWTIKYYMILLAFVFFGAALTLLVIVILQRLNLIPPQGTLAAAR